MVEPKQKMGCRSIQISELHLAENFVEDNIIYQKLLSMDIDKIQINGKKGNFYYVEFFFKDKSKLKIVYDENDKDKRKLFIDVQHIITKYVYHNNKEIVGEFGYITNIFEINLESLEKLKENLWSEIKYDDVKDGKGSYIRVKLYGKFYIGFFISKSDIAFFDFKVDKKIFVKRIQLGTNLTEVFVFDRDMQLENMSKINTNMQIPNSNLEYGVITIIELTKNKWNNPAYIITSNFNNGETNSYVTINDFNLFKFKVGDNFYLKGDKVKIFDRDKQMQISNLSGFENMSYETKKSFFRDDPFFKVNRQVGKFQNILNYYFNAETQQEMVAIEVISRNEFKTLVTLKSTFEKHNYQKDDLIMFELK